MSVLTEKTMVPISLILTVAGFLAGGFIWVGGLSAKVESQASGAVRLEAALKEIRSDRSSLDAEIIQQLKSLSIDANETRQETAVIKAQLTLLIKMVEKGQE